MSAYLEGGSTVPNRSVGYNSTDDIRDLHPVYLYAYLSLCTCIALLGLAGNIFLDYVIIRVRNLHTHTNLLLLSLTTADLLVCAIMIPIYLERFYSNAVHGNSNELLCFVRKFLFTLTSSCSLVSLACVSVDRMLAISYPFMYSQKITRRRIKLVIVFIWLWCGGLCGAIFYPFSSWREIIPSCKAGIPRTLYLIITPSCLYLPGIVIMVAYAKIYSVARRHHRKITLQQPVMLGNCQPHSQSVSSNAHASTSEIVDLPSQRCESDKRDRSQSRISALNNVINFSTRKIRNIGQELSVDMKAAKTIFILVGTMLFCWGPIALYYVYMSSQKVFLRANDKAFGYLHDSFMLLSFVNSALNPYLYSFLNSDIRKAAKKILLAAGSQQQVRF